MMNVLITIGENQFTNPFVKSLACAIKSKGINVVCSSTEIWNNWKSYDLIHIQWPHVLLKKDMKTIDSLELLLSDIKKSGTPIVVTCHNLQPHYSDNSLKNDAYNVVYKYADAFIHMGIYSYDLFKKKYPSALNEIIYHHIYDNIYNVCTFPSKESAIKKLGLSSKYSYILCMGAFRDEEEIQLVQLASDCLKNNGYKIIAPGLTKYTFRWKHPISSFKSYIKYKKIKLEHADIICSGKFISDDILPYYYGAADFAFIQRKEILNSGNVPMAFYMGKVVVGPDTGNVGPWLKELNNPTFSVNDLSSIKSALLEASNLLDHGIGENNQRYAQEKLSSSVIAEKHIDLYNKLLNVNI